MQDPQDHPDLVRLRSRTPSRIADRVGLALDPLILVVVCLFVVALRTATSAAAGIGWAAVTVFFCAVVPEAALRVVMRAKGIGDRQLVVREQRHLPLAIAVVSVVCGLAVLGLAGAPPAISAFVVTVLAGVVSMSLLTLVSKASFHAAVASAMTVVLVTMLGWAALVVCLPLVALIGWARVRAGRHSVAQVLVGGAMGLVSSLATFPLLA